MLKDFMKRFYQLSLVFILVSIVFLTGSSTRTFNTKTNNKTVTNTVDLNTMALKVQEDIDNDLYSAKDTYVGHLTGYVANCPLCTGYLACNNQNVLDGTEYYHDKEYGDVRIVASSRNLACGTVIRFNQSRISDEPIIAIVLDRGVLGTSLDLLTSSHDYAVKTIGRSTVEYDVLRESWGN